MAVISTLRSTSLNEQFAKFAKVYTVHRPVVQRILTTGFVLYVLGTTYRGLAARPSISPSASRKGKGKETEKEGAKPPRVAVSFMLASASVL
jgi:ATP-binding cassette, subfamily D (ALD), peroxisomal long-chain fatty acid import protein